MLPFNSRDLSFGSNDQFETLHLTFFNGVVRGGPPTIITERAHEAFGDHSQSQGLNLIKLSWPMIKIQAPNPRHLAHQSPLFQPTQPLGSIRLPFFHFKNIGRLSAHKVMFLVRLFVLVFFYPFFYLRTRNIIRNFVRPSVGPSVGPSIRPSMSTSRKV